METPKPFLVSEPRAAATGSALVYSTYLGGGDVDVGLGVAVDGAGSAYVTGYTFSTNFPTTQGAFQTIRAGSNDAFVTKMRMEVIKANTTTTVTSSQNPSTYGQPVTFTATVTAVAPGGGTPTGTVTFYDGTTVLGTATLNSSGQATFTTSSLFIGTHPITQLTTAMPTTTAARRHRR